MSVMIFDENGAVILSIRQAAVSFSITFKSDTEVESDFIPYMPKIMKRGYRIQVEE